MGLNLRAGNYQELFDPDDSLITAMLRSHLGQDVPLGEHGHTMELGDEMGWSWWNQLKDLAREQLGEGACPQIHATDAWNAVYIDAPINRMVLWADGKPAKDRPLTSTRTTDLKPASTWRRLLRRVGLERKPSKAPDDAIARIMDHLVEANGARAEERGALQVGNLRLLMAELGQLLGCIGVEATPQAVEALRRSYSDTDDRCDDDPGIQCLCHAWLTGSFALANRTPLWLIK